MSVHDLAERLERAYRIALLLQGRLADRGDHSDEAAFEPMTLAVELVALLDDARAALLRQAHAVSGTVLQAHGTGSGRHAPRSAARCVHGMHGACPICKESLMNSTSTTSAVISSDHVEGTKVYNTVGDKLGSIDDLMIDKVSGQVRYAVLEFGGFLGIGSDRYPLPWNMLKYDTTKEGYVVPLDKDRLEKAPRYPSEQRPAYDDAYGRRVNDYYGVPHL